MDWALSIRAFKDFDRQILEVPSIMERMMAVVVQTFSTLALDTLVNSLLRTSQYACNIEQTVTLFGEESGYATCCKTDTSPNSTNHCLVLVACTEIHSRILATIILHYKENKNSNMDARVQTTLNVSLWGHCCLIPSADIEQEIVK